MSKRKKYNPHDPVLQNLNNVAYKMKNNNLTVGDTYSMLLGYQHIFYIQGMIREGIAASDNIRYLNKIKKAFETALHKVVDSCLEDESGILCGNKNVAIKLHKLTRQKILFFVERFKLLHKTVNKSQNAKLIKYARETLDISIMARDLPLRQFLY